MRPYQKDKGHRDLVLSRFPKSNFCFDYVLYYLSVVYNQNKQSFLNETIKTPRLVTRNLLWFRFEKKSHSALKTTTTPRRAGGGGGGVPPIDIHDLGY